jgi:hypothetical protein
MYHFRVTLQSPFNHSLSVLLSRPIMFNHEKPREAHGQRLRNLSDIMVERNELMTPVSESRRSGLDEEATSLQTAQTLLRDLIARRDPSEERQPEEEQAKQDTTVDADQATELDEHAPIVPPLLSLGIYLSSAHTNASVNPQLSAQGYVPHTELYTGLWSNVSCLLRISNLILINHRSTKVLLELHATS